MTDDDIRDLRDGRMATEDSTIQAVCDAALEARSELGKLRSTLPQDSSPELTDDDIQRAQIMAQMPPVYVWCDTLVRVCQAALAARAERDKLKVELEVLTTGRNLYREMLEAANKDLSKTKRALQQVRSALAQVTRLGIRLSGRRW